MNSKKELTDYQAETNILFSDYKQRAKDACEVYRRLIKPEYTEKCEEIKKILKDVVDAHAKETEFSLIYANASAKDIPFYEITYRTKRESSLEEKIIRKKQYYKVYSDATSKEERDQDIKEAILRENDDLIGIRFLVSLHSDADRLFELFKIYKDEFLAQDIQLLNLDANPDIMKNGKKIYKIKSVYKNQYAFELQIKSKIESAWGDIEHMLFYKDYAFSYNQDVNKKFMNRIGNLLEEADALIQLIRDDKVDYSSNREEMEFNQKLGDRYMELIQKNLGSAFILRDLRDICWDFYSSYPSTRKKEIMNKMSEEEGPEKFLLFKASKELADTDLWRRYQELKKENIELILIEHIYLDWQRSNYKGRDIEETKGLNEDDLYNYLRKFVKLIIENRLGSDTGEKMDTFINAVFRSLKDCLNSEVALNDKHLVIFDFKALRKLKRRWKKGEVGTEELFVG